jgi:GT2 family glycosyltransferase
VTSSGDASAPEAGASDGVVPPPSLSVGVVVYQAELRVLVATLESLQVAVARARAVHEVDRVALTVIDNGTDDVPGLERAVASVLPSGAGVDLETRRGQGNVGYGRGHNLAIAGSGADFHLVLNPDVLLEPDAILEALRFLRAHPEVGLLAPEVRGEDGGLQYLCRRYPSVLVLLLRGFAPDFVQRRFARRLHHYELRDQLEQPVVRQIPLASGCFMFARRALLQAVGGFSPGYFLYFEDYDLSLRLHRLAEIAYVRRVRIRHFGGGAAGKGGRQVRLFVESAYRFFRTHGWKLL